MSSDEEAISETEASTKTQTKNETEIPESEKNSTTQAFNNVTNANDVGSILNQLA